MQNLINVKEIETSINGNGTFDKETIKRLLKSEEDIEKGRTRNAKEVIKELKEKYGF